ncbi:hypothetical protein U9M48_040638 [Paspalum notatum var. saurae]|uniref:NAD-dependent epimerase/dehydratase domain-containing protein n=1 Tax=Paspalum notatum var. saurae TaxID=547442 RepID=A0AAQ3XDZ5_PASNO
MEAAEPERATVCVTGAGGFLASWLVKLLLSTGRYAVRGTVRDPGVGKNAHITALEGAGERLRLVKADMLDYRSVASAVDGCQGVLHVASHVPSGKSSNPEADVIAPAVTGTLNVLKACHEAKVKRVVVFLLCSIIPTGLKARPSLRTAGQMRKREAFAYAAKTGLDVITVCPALVIGPLMQSTVNTSAKVFLGYIKGGEHSISTRDQETVQNGPKHLVDVRDVADALLLVYENPQASGRYLCNSTAIRVSDIVNILKTSYPSSYTYPQNFVEVEGSYTYNTEKLRNLGWASRPMEETLRDSFECYQALGIPN